MSDPNRNGAAASSRNHNEWRMKFEIGAQQASERIDRYRRTNMPRTEVEDPNCPLPSQNCERAKVGVVCDDDSIFHERTFQ